jgi:hypothetical protein
MTRSLAGVALLAAALSSGPSLKAADPEHPLSACTLLSTEDVAAVVGAKVEPGEPNDSGAVEGGGFSSTCLWKVAGAAVPSAAGSDAPFGGARFAMLNTITWPKGSGKAAKYLADFYQAAKDNLIDNEPVPLKVGDDALWWGDGVAVRKGDISFGVSTHTGSGKPEERAMEEALARKVAERLGSTH